MLVAYTFATIRLSEIDGCAFACVRMWCTGELGHVGAGKVLAAASPASFGSNVTFTNLPWALLRSLTSLFKLYGRWTFVQLHERDQSLVCSRNFSIEPYPFFVSDSTMYMLTLGSWRVAVGYCPTTFWQISFSTILEPAAGQATPGSDSTC